MKAITPDKGFEKICREGGLRITRQRYEVYRALAAREQHLSAEQVHQVVKRRLPHISLDTIYRTLDSFNQGGIIRKFLGPNGTYLYDSNPQPHHHAVCLVCGRIEDFDWPAFENLPLPDPINSDHLITARQAEIRVVCRRCRTK